MTNPNIIEFDLKEILLDIKKDIGTLGGRIDRLDGKINKLTDDVSDLRTRLVKAEEEIKGEIKVLEVRIDGIDKRMDTQDFINRGVIVGLVLAVLGGFAKVFGLGR